MSGDCLAVQRKLDKGMPMSSAYIFNLKISKQPIHPTLHLPKLHVVVSSLLASTVVYPTALWDSHSHGSLFKCPLLTNLKDSISARGISSTSSPALSDTPIILWLLRSKRPPNSISTIISSKVPYLEQCPSGKSLCANLKTHFEHTISACKLSQHAKINIANSNIFLANFFFWSGNRKNNCYVTMFPQRSQANLCTKCSSYL